MIFNDTAWRNGLVKLGKIYGNMGYVNFSPNRSFAFDEGEKIINLAIDVDEGRQYRISDIQWSRNTALSDTAIQRELLLREGDIYKQDLAERSAEKLEKLYGRRGRVNQLVKFGRDPQAPLVGLTFEFETAAGPGVEQ